MPLLSSTARPLPSSPLGLFPLTSTLLLFFPAGPLPSSPQDLPQPPLLDPSPHLTSRPLCTIPLGLFPPHLYSSLLHCRPLPASPQDLSSPPLLGPSPHLASTRPLCQGSKSCLSPLPLNPALSCILIRAFVSTGAHSDLEVLTSPSQNFCSNYCPHHKFCV